MAVINLRNIKDEWLFFLRNSDILSISDRGVTTAIDTGTFASDIQYLIITIIRPWPLSEGLTLIEFLNLPLSTGEANFNLFCNSTAILNILFFNNS